MATETQIISDLGECGIRRVGAQVPFERVAERRGENVEAASTSYLCEKSGSEKGSVHGSLREC